MKQAIKNEAKQRALNIVEKAEVIKQILTKEVEQFNATLDATIESIYQASNT